MDKRIVINYRSLSNTGLDEETTKLLQEAEKACERAYAPYSKFKVGAAVMLKDGTIVCGSNVENASYSLTNCAERVVCQFVKTNYPNQEMKIIAIVGSGNVDISGGMFSPCGACRQVILELELEQKSPVKVLLKQPNNEVLEFSSVQELLPLGFGIK